MSKETWICPACNKTLPKSVGQCHHRPEQKQAIVEAKPIEEPPAKAVVEKPAPKKKARKKARKIDES